MIKHKIEINSNIYKLAETFRNLVSFVFDGLGKDADNTRFETFNDIGSVRIDSTATGFFSFRNEEFFYWIFLKVTHSGNSGNSQKLWQEFEVQIKRENVPILQIYGENPESGFSDLDLSTKVINLLYFEFADEYEEFAQKFLQKIENKLKVTTYEPIAA